MRRSLDSADRLSGNERRDFWAAPSNTGTRLCSSTFLGKPTVGIMLPAPDTAEHYARLFVQLKRAGTPIPDNDLWIAALALEHDLLLITRDRHFDRVPQLQRS